MKRQPLVTLFLLLVLTHGDAQKKNIPLSALEQSFSNALADWHVAGFAVGVIYKGQIIYQKGFGYRDLDKKLPASEKTLFAIGSCTKAFTASLIGILNYQGIVQLDVPVITYLPGFRFYNEDMDHRVTLRNMMDHTTGMPRHDYSWYIFNTSSRDSLISRLQYLQPNTQVGTRWQYNNFMYAMQGYLAEKLTGKSWEDNVREHFFIPLEMTASNFDSTGLMGAKNASKGYILKRDSLIAETDYHNIAAMSPAGSINSNIEDLSKWLLTWMNQGKYQGKQIIPIPFYYEATSSQSIMSPGYPSPQKPDLFFQNYGFGWNMSAYRGHYRVDHSGNIDGFTANICFFPTDSLGIIILSNQDNSQLPSIVRNLIADQVLHLTPYEWSRELKKMVARPKPTKKTRDREAGKNGSPTHALSAYTGVFYNPGYGMMRLSLSNDSLFVQAGNVIWWLRHDNYDVFRLISKEKGESYNELHPDDALPLQFQLDFEGNITGLSVLFEPQVSPIVFTRINDPSSSSYLTAYTGDYNLSGTSLKVILKNNSLFIIASGQPEYELSSLGKNKFKINVADGYFVQFEVDADKNVLSLTLIQPNGDFKATKIN